MTETNPDESARATPNAPAEQQPNNEQAVNRDREHEILQQVLALLSQPQIPEDANRLLAENQELRSALSSMASLLRDKSGQVLAQERKIGALASQITSLKEVVTITKELLNIRDMEVKHLSKDMQDMEVKLDEQRRRHNDMIEKIDQATKLNSALKQEYETQLKIFQDLKESYAKRDVLMQGQINQETPS